LASPVGLTARVSLAVVGFIVDVVGLITVGLVPGIVLAAGMDLSSGVDLDRVDLDEVDLVFELD